MRNLNARRAPLSCMLLAVLVFLPPQQSLADGVACIGRSLVGQYDLPGRATAIELIGDIALAGHDEGVWILDISSPDSPVILSTIDTENSIAFIKVIGTTAYISVNGFEMLMYDMSNPSSPVLIGSIDSASTARDLAVKGDLALCCLSRAELIPSQRHANL